MLHRLYNLIISADKLFLELPIIPKAKADLEVQVVNHSDLFQPLPNCFMNWTLPGGEKWLSCAKTKGGYLLRFNELADFEIDKTGSQIFCKPRPAIPENTIQHLLLDQVIPLVINLRGGEALHASAMLAPQGVIAFAGLTGSGKSTLAGSFLFSGYQHVSDDCLTLSEMGREIYAIPAYPGLRLWDDALSYLFGPNGAHESVAHYTDKRRVELEKRLEAHCTEPQPLRRLYSIADPTEANGKTDIIIERLSPRESFMALVRCTFRFDITDREMLIRQFNFLQRVASTVSVCRLIFPRDFNLLPAVRESIIKDLNDLDN